APAPMNDEPIEKVGNSNSVNSSVSGTISISENKEPRNRDSEINNIVSDQFFKHLINSETSNDKKRKQADTTDPENTSNYKKMTTMNTQPKANAAAQNAKPLPQYSKNILPTGFNPNSKAFPTSGKGIGPGIEFKVRSFHLNS
ncbi:hypothetical protein CBL_20978, partial [Carabus blaptoides fortunei]